MAHPDPRGTGARGKTRKLLAGNLHLLPFAPQKSNHQNTAGLERPRSHFPIFWRPDRTAPGTALAGLVGES